MAEMTQTLSSMRQSIERKLHARDSAGPLKSAIDRAINDAYSRVMTSHEWVWAQAEGAMLTYGEITESTGGVGGIGGGNLTVSGAGNVTLTAANTAVVANVGSGWVIKDDTRRSITAQTAGAMTLAIGWPDTVAVTTYSLNCVAYNPSTLSIGKAYYVSVEKDGEETELDYMNAPRFQEQYISCLQTGMPEFYTILRYSSLGNPMFGFGPIPDDTYQITFRYYRRPLKLSADVDTFILPPQWHYVIEEGALADLAGSFLQDPMQAAKHKSEFMQALRLMQAESQGSTQVTYYFGGEPRETNWDMVDPRV